jgi:hypothetical protein
MTSVRSGIKYENDEAIFIGTTHDRRSVGHKG